MPRRSPVFLTFALFVCLFCGLASAQTALVAYVYGDFIAEYDLSTGLFIQGTERQLVDTVGMTDPAACNGMSVHPTTGVVYVMLQIVGATGRSLATMDPTGDVTVIGDTGDNIAGIAFDSTGTLWGVTGDGATTGETVWTIDLVTAALTTQVTLGAGSDGESIVFDAGTGLLYTSSGRDTNAAITSIDPVSLATVAITRTGFNSDEMFSMLHDPVSGLVYGANLDQEVLTLDFAVPGAVFITDTGFSTADGVGMPAIMVDYWKGMVLVGGGCSITSPLAGTMAMSNSPVDITFDASDVAGGAIDALFEFSTDMGVTWNPMTPDAGSALANPAVGLAAMTVGSIFTWDAGADGLSTMMPTPVDIRISTSSPSYLSQCQSDVTVQVGGGSCTITSPPPMTMAMSPSPVDITFDADDLLGGAIDALFEFSTDMGMTWNPMTADAGSALANPAVGLAAMTVGATFTWDAGADGLAAMMPTPAGIRISTMSPTFLSQCLSDVIVEPGCPGACGDCNVNMSGPDIVDSLVSAQIAAGIIMPSMAQTFCCDVNGSGTIDVLDALLIAQTAAGLPIVLTCP